MEILDLIAGAAPVVLLLLVTWVTGRAAERRHFRSLAARERENSRILVTDLEDFPFGGDPSRVPTLVVAQVVLGADYLKGFLAALKKILGGEMRSYATVVERARREAILRLAEEARSLGCDAVCNVRIQAADIGGATMRNGSAMVCAVASGTAYKTLRSAQ